MAENLVSNIPHANIVTDKLSACASALDDLKDMYNNKFLTDVNIKTNTNSFPAHKIVLCARSPVFKVMFSNDMREKNSDSTQVDDLDDDTVQQLLLFLYSDAVEDLRWETASKLYYAADKYQIEKLKLLCSCFLIENLTVSTATELLALADSHSDSDLKQVVEDFILKHDEDVFNSEKWEGFMKVNPQLALKLMHLKYKTKKSDSRRVPRQPSNLDLHAEKEDIVFSSPDDSSKQNFPDRLFPIMAKKNNSSTADFTQDVTNSRNGRYQQKQMNKFQDFTAIQNIAPENSHFQNSHVEMETYNFLDYNQRQETSVNALGITFKKRVSPDLHRHVNSTEARRRLNRPERYKTSRELHRRGRHQQKQIYQFQDIGIQNISAENTYSENFDADTETDNFVYTNDHFNQGQESFENSSGINIKQRVSPELDRSKDSTEARRLNLPEMKSQIMPPSDSSWNSFVANLERFLIFCCVFLVVSVCAYFFLLMGYGYLSTSYGNDHFSTTTLVNRLRSKFKDQPPLTFRIIGSALKNVLEAQPNSPAIILLLATNGSQTICSEFALNLVDSLSVPKYTVKIYGENYKQENANQVKMEIDQIISKVLKYNQMGSVLIEDLDQIPGLAALILHKYYDHENAPFKKAVFVMTVNYNKPISDYHDSKVWQTAANDHLLSVWADTGIDQLSALLSRLTVSVAVITTETLY